jgi:hypothetical protein
MVTSPNVPGAPGFGDLRVPLGARAGDAEPLGRLVDGQAAKEAQLNNATLLLVNAGEVSERIILRYQVRVSCLRREGRGLLLDLLEFDLSKANLAVRAALRCTMTSRVIHQNLPHKPGADGEEVRVTLSLKRAPAY